MEADVLHRRSNDRFVGPRQHITAVAVHDRGASTVGPGERGHLAPHRSYGDRPGNSLDLASPRSGREDDIARAVSSILANDADGTITSQIDPDRGVRHDLRSGPFGVGQQRSNEALRLDGPFVRGPERTRAFGQARAIGRSLRRHRANPRGDSAASARPPSRAGPRLRSRRRQPRRFLLSKDRCRCRSLSRSAGASDAYSSRPARPSSRTGSSGPVSICGASMPAAAFQAWPRSPPCSTTTTRRPLSANSRAQAAPMGPPPTIATSVGGVTYISTKLFETCDRR